MKNKTIWFSMGLAALVAMQGARAELSADTKQEIEQLIGDYLRQNPQVVIDAIQAWRQQQEAAEAARIEAAIEELRQAVAQGDAPSWGNPKGKTVVIEFSDYNCPYCKRVFPEVAKLVDEDGDIRIVMKELPVLGPASEYAAKAALAAHKQGKYEAFHHQMMRSGSRVSRQAVDRAAKAAGLDMERLKKEMESPEVAAELAHNQLWAERLGISGTPAFVIGNEVIPGAIDARTMKRLVEQARQSD